MAAMKHQEELIFVIHLLIMLIQILMEDDISFYVSHILVFV